VSSHAQVHVWGCADHLPRRCPGWVLLLALVFTGELPMRLGAPGAAALPDPTLIDGRSPAPTRRRCSREGVLLGYGGRSPRKCGGGFFSPQKAVGGKKTPGGATPAAQRTPAPLRRSERGTRAHARASAIHLRLRPGGATANCWKVFFGRCPRPHRAESPGAPDVGEPRVTASAIFTADPMLQKLARRNRAAQPGRQLEKANCTLVGEQRPLLPGRGLHKTL